MAPIPSPPTPPVAAVLVSGAARVRIFVDFWNLQLTISERELKHNHNDPKFKQFHIDWLQLPKKLIAEVSALLGAPCAYEGTNIYTSYDGKTESGRKHHKWATDWLDRQAGMQVNCYERQPKNPPKCNHCYKPIESCPHCSQQIAGTVEKGVDTAIVTDMIRLAWEKAFDIAIIVSSDADMVPAVEFLDLRGFKIIQAGFPPKGSHLAKSCWASIDLFACRESFRRSVPTP